MPLEHHPLSREFPEYHQELKALHDNDARFAQVAAEYEELDRQIYTIEDGCDAMDDLALQELKQKRVAMKDMIAERLAQTKK